MKFFGGSGGVVVVVGDEFSLRIVEVVCLRNSKFSVSVFFWFFEFSEKS